MRDILTCIILAVLIAAFIIVPHNFIAESSHDMQTILKKADSALKAEKWDKVTKLCSYALKKWEKYSPVYEMATEHETVDQIMREMRQLCSYAEEKEKPEARALIRELRFLIKHIEEMDELSPENIL